MFYNGRCLIGFIFEICVEDIEPENELSEIPESPKEERGIFGTIRDWISPESEETPESKKLFTFQSGINLTF